MILYFESIFLIPEGIAAGLKEQLFDFASAAPKGRRSAKTKTRVEIILIFIPRYYIEKLCLPAFRNKDTIEI